MDSEIRDATILFTDIEGSTRLWETEPQRMSVALARHDAMARSAVQVHRGVIVKMTGDGFMAAFTDPADGINACLALQQALSDAAKTNGLQLRIRSGLHKGPVEQRDNDLFGPPVNRTARLMAVGHGGQILVSQAVADGVEARLPDGVTLLDLGGVRLKDLTAPEHVYQIVHPALRRDFPALRSLEATPNNLPQQLTTFVGREREIAEAQGLLSHARLLTLLGMGGLGKTRLSLQVAANALEGCPDGAWFLDLAAITDPSLVQSEAARTLGVQEEPGRPLIQTLCAHVKQRKMLIILDNCEHLVNACAELANALLRAGAQVRIIATSREALRVPGEQTYPVMPLAVPDATAGVETLAKSEAVQLFVDRARLHKPSFSLTEREAPAVAELCTRLEGIPLALELAAARMRTLSVADINARLRDRFKLLTGGGRVLLERQQTLRALVDWSYDLLQEEERVLFDRLSVFSGGFDLAAAEAICGAEPLTPEDVLDLVASLVDKSLVMAEESGEISRYRTLETIRDYAREKLIARADQLPTATRHCDHFLTMAKAANMGLRGPEQADWTRRIEADLDNVRAAISLCLEERVDPVLAVKFAVALMGFFILRGYSTEGRRYVRTALSLAAVTQSDIGHAHALYVGAALAASQSDYSEAARMLESCLALRRGLANPVDIAATLSTLSLVRLHMGDSVRAREGETEALAIFRELEDRIGEAIGLLHLGQICLYGGDDDEARTHLEECLVISGTIGHAEIHSEAERMLGEIALEAGNVAEARSRFERSLQDCRDSGDKRDEASSQWWIARADLAANDQPAAGPRLAEALRAFQSFGMNEEMLGSVEDHGRLAHALGRHEQAAHMFAAVACQRERLSLARPPRREKRFQEALAATQQALGDAPFETAWKHAHGWSLEKTVDYALASATPEEKAPGRADA